MDMDYAEAVNQLQDEISSACARVEGTLSNAEVAKELRRIADEIEAD